MYQVCPSGEYYNADHETAKLKADGSAETTSETDADGNVNVVTVMVADPKCVPASIGYQASKKTTQEPCPIGRYADVGGLKRCKLCPRGTKAKHDGKGIAVTGATACEPCPVGTYSEPGSESCTPCREGEFAEREGSAQCSRCATGTYQPAKGQTVLLEHVLVKVICYLDENELP